MPRGAVKEDKELLPCYSLSIRLFDAFYNDQPLHTKCLKIFYPFPSRESESSPPPKIEHIYILKVYLPQLLLTRLKANNAP